MNQTEVLYMEGKYRKGNTNLAFRHVEYLEDHFMKIQQEANAQYENDSSVDVDIEGDNKKPTWWRGHDLSFSKGNLIVVEGITEERKIILLPLLQCDNETYWKCYPIVGIRSNSTRKAKLQPQ